MSNEMNKMMENELENVSGGAGLTNQYYVVVPGDTLGEIAARFGTTVKKLQALNPRIKDANLIYAGEAIRIF